MDANNDGEEELEYQENAAGAAPVAYDIVLEGQLLMIYQRDEEEPENISNFNMVLKGTWSLNSDENAEDFIYKRIGLP